MFASRQPSPSLSECTPQGSVHFADRRIESTRGPFVSDAQTLTVLSSRAGVAEPSALRAASGRRDASAAALAASEAVVRQLRSDLANARASISNSGSIIRSSSTGGGSAGGGSTSSTSSTSDSSNSSSIGTGATATVAAADQGSGGEASAGRPAHAPNRTDAHLPPAAAAVAVFYRIEGVSPRELHDFACAKGETQGRVCTSRGGSGDGL